MAQLFLACTKAFPSENHHQGEFWPSSCSSCHLRALRRCKAVFYLAESAWKRPNIFYSEAVITGLTLEITSQVPGKLRARLPVTSPGPGLHPSLEDSRPKRKLRQSLRALGGSGWRKSQRLTALAALQNFTIHNPHVRKSISFFIKYMGPFHKLLLLVHLATCSFYELLEFQHQLEKSRRQPG